MCISHTAGQASSGTQSVNRKQTGELAQKKSLPAEWGGHSADRLFWILEAGSSSSDTYRTRNERQLIRGGGFFPEKN
jgi:hypothetical protein